jgi:hypothetical protein
MLTIPKILDNPAFLIEEVAIQWDEKMLDYFTYDVQNKKLVDAFGN